jgi:mono/diheme cytochrome c family protein
MLDPLRRPLTWTCFLALLLVGRELPAASPPARTPAVPADHARQMAQGRELFTTTVRGLLVERCLKCHGGDKTRGGLSMVTRESLLKGGDNGPVVVPGKRGASKLHRLAAHLDDPAMPPPGNSRLQVKELAALARWIDLGAPYDKPLIEKGGTRPKGLLVSAEDRNFWSFRPLRRPELPSVGATAWACNPIDRFLLSRMEAQGLTPTSQADRRTLIRRACFDLTGLPPTPEEVSSFVADPSPLAYEKLIDRLLASPHHGERWARHWLDVARFAESHGFEHDYDRPTAYPYRDFVIKALNLDLPYDTFTRWQLAGDEIEPDNPLALTATGFLGAGVHSTQITAATVEKERYDELDDIVRTMGTAMLGLTVGCARCHDHKYDPVPVRDYYRLVAMFTKTVRADMEVDLEPALSPDARRRHQAEIARREEALQKHEQDVLWPKVLVRLPASPGSKPSTSKHLALLRWYRSKDATWRKLNAQLQQMRAREKSAGKSKAMICSEGLPPIRLHSQGADFLEHTHFLKRGDPNQKDGIATPGFLQVLTRSAGMEKRWHVSPPPGSRTPYQRRALANWITDVEQGAGALLARVIVNRLWQHHFGRGIVATTSDFGLQGERPTHPELLDWLASELIANGWRLKPIHKLIVTSAAYRQATTFDPARAVRDPDNRLLWRRVPRRLEAEVIRDSLLAVSDQLDRRMFGPGTLDPNHKRRSIYFFVKRSQLVPMMVLFDAPDGTVGIEQRTTTTIAPQALLLMNNTVVRSASARLAQRLQARNDPPEQVRFAYALTLGRAPKPAELTAALGFLHEQRTAYNEEKRPDAPQRALADFCQVLLGLNEFVYID